MKIKPILNQIIIKPNLSEIEKRAQESGIALPEKMNKEGSPHGVVLYVGPGKWSDSGERIPIEIKVGDTVFYHRNFAVPVTLGDEKLICVKEDECQLAIED